MTQQHMVVSPTLPPKEFPGTDHHDAYPSPWSDQDEVSDPEYPEQPDNLGANPGSSCKQEVTLEMNQIRPSHNMMIK